jgi:hypothetical protein
MEHRHAQRRPRRMCLARGKRNPQASSIFSPPTPQEGPDVQRKITQIAATPPADDCPPSIYALCDDGSVWDGHWGQQGTFRWSRLPDIPQDAGRPATFRWSD